MSQEPTVVFACLTVALALHYLANLYLTEATAPMSGEISGHNPSRS